MKITEILRNASQALFSCEFFPPKTDEGMAQLLATLESTKTLNPGFISVTYGAGGSTRDKTLEIIRRAKNEFGLQTMAHLTCVGRSEKELRDILDSLADSGIENVIALRGDPPKGQSGFTAHPQGFRHAEQLVSLIKRHYSFCVAVAGYPEGHPESLNRQTDWDYLKKKIDSGADLVITQLFFDNRDFFELQNALQTMSVKIPLLPGIMPVTNFAQLVRFTDLCGAKIPPGFKAELEKVKEDPGATETLGIEHAAGQCRELLKQGVPGVHFYTLNKSKSTQFIVERLRHEKIL